MLVLLVVLTLQVLLLRLVLTLFSRAIFRSTLRQRRKTFFSASQSIQGSLTEGEGSTKETLLNGKAYTNLFRLAPFYTENIIYIFSKTSYLNEEVNGTEPSPSVSIPLLCC